MPERIQLRRTKGWRMPANTVKVDRTSKWGNPFKIDYFGIPTAADAVLVYRLWLDGMIPGPVPPADFTALRGKNLACWCKPGQPCHADVLLEIANAEQNRSGTGTAEIDRHGDRHHPA